MIKNKKKINFSKEDKISSDEISTKDCKVRITTYIDLDILEELKAQAKKEGEKYQHLLNKYLRACIFKEIKESDLRALAISSQNVS